MYKDLKHANTLSLDRNDYRYRVDLSRYPDDDDYTTYTNLHDAMAAYQAVVANEEKCKNPEYAIFLCAEEVDEEEEIVFSTPIDCYVVFRKGRSNIVLSGINAKLKE